MESSRTFSNDLLSNKTFNFHSRLKVDSRELTLALWKMQEGNKEIRILSCLLELNLNEKE